MSINARYTPLTDAAALGFARLLFDWDKGSCTELIDANFARALERCLKAAMEELFLLGGEASIPVLKEIRVELEKLK